MRRGAAAQLLRSVEADAVRHVVAGPGPYRATCLVCGDWWLALDSIVLMEIAEHHRQDFHCWVKPGRVHRLDDA